MKTYFGFECQSGNPAIAWIKTWTFALFFNSVSILVIIADEFSQLQIVPGGAAGLDQSILVEGGDSLAGHLSTEPVGLFQEADPGAATSAGFSIEGSGQGVGCGDAPHTATSHQHIAFYCSIRHQAGDGFYGRLLGIFFVQGLDVDNRIMLRFFGI